MSKVGFIPNPILLQEVSEQESHIDFDSFFLLRLDVVIACHDLLYSAYSFMMVDLVQTGSLFKATRLGLGWLAKVIWL